MLLGQGIETCDVIRLGLPSDTQPVTHHDNPPRLVCRDPGKKEN